jgi:hypothetical protein
MAFCPVYPEVCPPLTSSALVIVARTSASVRCTYRIVVLMLVWPASFWTTGKDRPFAHLVMQV